MATSSRQTSIFGIEDWRSLYKTYNQADFQSYNFETLRKSFVDYLRQHHPEDFNDYVESSEFIALLDTMAFMGQAISYRQDLNTRENFLDTAERRDSVVKLADLVSYTPKRNECASGFLKVTSVSTTENITDFNGTNLANVTMRWNDSTNIDWQDQFNTVMNAMMVDSQKIGKPGRTADVLGIKTDEYTVNLTKNLMPVIPFNATVNGANMDFEVTSATTTNKTFVYEPAPVLNGDFNILNRNDKKGFASVDNGFFFHFKQGTLTNKDFTLSDRIANRNVDINTEGVNNNDVWLYELDKTTGTVLNEWEEVDNIYAPNTKQTKTSDRKYFSVTGRANDQITMNFGDGVFGDVPTGFFRAFIRVSNGRKYIINTSDITGINITVPYVSRNGRAETATFTVTLTQNISNATTKESITDIKRNAPARYYTQDRMVNGEDYNNFPYTAFSSIIKSKAVARSNIGTSRHLDLVDPTGKYSSINTFNSDGLIYKDTVSTTFTFSFDDKNDIESVIKNQVESSLSKRSTVHLYHSNFNRSSLSAIDIAWNQSTTNTNETTGYFKSSTTAPLPIGSYVSDNRKHLSANALVKFETPTSDASGVYYFDENNHLKQRDTLLPTDNTTIWSSIKTVTLEGTNFGVGNNTDGTGPVVLSDFVPTNAVPTEIIPVYNSNLPLIFEQDILAQIELYVDFGIGYNNDTGTWYVISSSNLDKTGDFSLDNAESTLGLNNDASWIIKFVTVDNVYTVTTRALNYYFSSVLETRFYFGGHNKIFDPKTGKVVNDFVNVLKTNTQPGSNSSLSNNIKLDIIGQPVESDGFVNDFKVEVSYTDIDNDGVADNPDFFTNLSQATDLVFFQTTVDADSLERVIPLASGVVNTEFTSATDPLLVISSYPDGQLFYLADEVNKFRKLDTNVVVCETDQYPHSSPCELVPVTDISLKTGRQNLQFQYKHNSSETKRINPGLTNIIDMFLVTDAYYTEYKKYIQDTTNTVTEPSTPTISELTSAYQSLQDNKMLSDNIVLNSVVFKPLFGNKASDNLRADISVVKVQNSIVSDSEIKSQVVVVINDYFNIEHWSFGDTFYFSELTAYIHDKLGDIVSSVVLVSTDINKTFGDLYEIKSATNEIFVNAVTVDNVKVIKTLTSDNLNGVA